MEAAKGLQETKVVEDTYFIQFVKEEITALRLQRNARPEPKPGFKYKRDWYDRMTDEGVLNADFFIQEIELIVIKKSTLCSLYRDIIYNVCRNAYIKMELKYKEEREAETLKLEKDE